MADIIAICEKETVFVQILAECLRNKFKKNLDIEAFDDADRLIEAAKEKTILLCLLGEKMADSFALDTLLKLTQNIIYLSGKRREDRIFKYQSVERIVADLLRICAEREIPLLKEKLLLTRRSDVKVLGFYAPSRHLMQSTIALTMGQILAKENKVLYLNLEPYSGFEYLLQKTYDHDLMDIIFFLKEDKEKFRLRMESMLERIGGLDYIPPIFCYSDFEEIDSLQWQKLLERIIGEMDYEILLLDLTEHTRGLLSLLELCDEIFTCLPGDRLSLARAEQYERMLYHMKKDHLLERTKKSIVPSFHDIPPSAAMFTHTQLASYIKDIREARPVKDVEEDRNEGV